MGQDQELVAESVPLGAAAETLIAEWERRARRKLIDAERETNPMGRRLIEHGAMCYFNCAQELKAAVPTAVSPLP